MAEPGAGASGAGMRVAFLVDRWEPRRGGAESALAALALALEARGARVLALARRAAPGAPGTFREVRAGGILRPERERRLAAALLAAAREERADLTIGMRHLAALDLYWPHGGGVGASLAARARAEGREPGEPGASARVFLDLERRLLAEGGARRIACVSRLVADELARAHPACRERLRLHPNGVDLERFHPRNRATLGPAVRARLGIAPGEVLIAFLAREPGQKGLPELLTALARIPRSPWRLVAAGARHPRRWAREARQLGLDAGRVALLPEADAAELLAGADLLAHPTWRDACSLVVLEALASGVPAIATRLDGASEALADPGQGSLLMDPSSAEALAGELERWIDRARSGAVDRELVRAAVAGRGREAWLAGLADLVLGEIAGLEARAGAR